MTKKDLHFSLRLLKQQLKDIKSWDEYMKIVREGLRITTAMYDKGCSKTDIKLMLAWESDKEKTRIRIGKGVA